MKILFALASPIVRPNGIMTFITQSAKILRSQGHAVGFISDAEPSINLNQWFDEVIYDPWHTVDYPFEMKDGNPHIRFLPHIQNRIQRLWMDVGLYDVVISNDAQSTAAFLDSPKHTKLIHYIHTGALIGPNLTFLSDSYVQLEREILGYCEVAAQHEITLKNAAGKDGHIIHLPLDPTPFLESTKKSGVLFIGEGSERKGAGDFIRACDAGNFEAKIISSYNNDFFLPRQARMYDTNAQIEKAQFISSAKVGYHPSWCECFPYAVIEMLLTMPVVLHSEYKWTEPHAELGAIVVPKADAVDAIREAMEMKYDNSLVLDYLNKVPKQWEQLLKDL